MEKNCGFFSGDEGEYVDIVDYQIMIRTNQYMDKADTIHKPSLSLKSGLFPLAFWLVNLALTEKYDTKNCYELISPWLLL